MFEGVKKFWEELTTREKIALGVVVAGVAGYALYTRYKNGQAAQSSPTGNVQQPVDLNGVPLNGTDLNGVFSTVPGTIGPGAPGNNSIFALIRSAGAVPGFDKAHSGVPIRSAPGGSIIGYAPFSSQIQLVGSSIAGPVNMQGGSSLWYPVIFNGQNGYISAFDVSLGTPTGTINLGTPTSTVNMSTAKITPLVPNRAVNF